MKMKTLSTFWTSVHCLFTKKYQSWNRKYRNTKPEIRPTV